MSFTATLPTRPSSEAKSATFDPSSIKRPDKSLLRYYLLAALVTGPAYPIAILPLIFKYETLKYSFDDTGISMSWGFLFRREVHLTYRRIQDIHLTRNILQRWMGLATVSVQTASGGASPEMSIEGILEAEALRDFLYAQMRGARDGKPANAGASAIDVSTADVRSESDSVSSDEALRLLREIRDAIREKKERLS
jgi:uncharacterized membrane protein YdbT with pleckstrin-like domain